MVRMLSNLVGPEGFRKGTDLYFSRHDGEAVTCDDFVKAIEDANGINLDQFKNWYSQAGTPELTISGKYDSNAKTYSMNVKQQTPATPGQKHKKPFHIPLAVGLIDSDGNDMDLQVADVVASSRTPEFLSSIRKSRPLYLKTSVSHL